MASRVKGKKDSSCEAGGGVMQSNLMFDFGQAEDSLNNILDERLDARKWATDALIRFAKIKGRVEQIEKENERLNELLKEKVK
jgi:hypothetical protein